MSAMHWSATAIVLDVANPRVRPWRCFSKCRANRHRCACEGGYAATHLALAVYQSGMPKRRPTHADRVAVLRAARTLARKYPNKFVLIGGKGRMPLLLNPQHSEPDSLCAIDQDQDPPAATSTRNHWSAKRALRRFWWTSDLVQAKGLAC
jgi:hypothetical protein